MTFEEIYQNFVLFAIDISSVAAAALSILLTIQLYRLSQKENQRIKAQNILLGFFTFFTIAIILFTIAELIWHVQTVTTGIPEVSIADGLWITGVLIEYLVFIVFTIYLSVKNHAPLKKTVSFIALTLALAIVLFIFLKLFIYKFQQEDTTQFLIFLNYFYPISSLLLFIVNFYVAIFFIDQKMLGIAFFLVSAYNFLSFLGDITFAYYSLQEIYGFVGFISDTAYAFSYVVLFIALYLLLNSSVNPTKK